MLLPLSFFMHDGILSREGGEGGERTERGRSSTPGRWEEIYYISSSLKLRWLLSQLRDHDTFGVLVMNLCMREKHICFDLNQNCFDEKAIHEKL